MRGGTQLTVCEKYFSKLIVWMLPAGHEGNMLGISGHWVPRRLTCSGESYPRKIQPPTKKKKATVVPKPMQFEDPEEDEVSDVDSEAQGDTKTRCDELKTLIMPSTAKKKWQQRKRQ